METIRITNIKQLAEYKDKLNDEKFLAETRFDLSECESIKIHIKGEHFDSSINSNIMRTFVFLQDEIYREYAQVVYGTRDLRKLSSEEKQSLQLYIRVDEGSTILTIFLESLFEVIIEKLAETAIDRNAANKIVICIASLFEILGSFFIENYLFPEINDEFLEKFVKPFLKHIINLMLDKSIEIVINGIPILRKKIEVIIEKINEYLRNKKNNKNKK